METQTIINIIAIIISPLVAVPVGEILRKRNFKKESELRILNNLVSYRHKVESDEFLSALNSLKLFYKNEGLNNLSFELRKSFQRQDASGEGDKGSSALIAKIIKKVCELEKFKHITIEDI